MVIKAMPEGCCTLRKVSMSCLSLLLLMVGGIRLVLSGHSKCRLAKACCKSGCESIEYASISFYELIEFGMFPYESLQRLVKKVREAHWDAWLRGAKHG